MLTVDIWLKGNQVTRVRRLVTDTDVHIWKETDHPRETSGATAGQFTAGAGGSSTATIAAPVKSPAEQMTTPITDLGVKLLSGKDLDAMLTNYPGYKPPGTTVKLGPDHEQAFNAVASALKDFPTFNKRTTLMLWENPPGKTASMAGGNTSTASFITLSTDRVAPLNDRLFDKDAVVNTAPNREAQRIIDAGGSREEAIHAFWRACTFHEIGHLKDQYLNMGITKQITTSLDKQFNGDQAKITEWVAANISNYASTNFSAKRGGWFEATAELFAMKRMGMPIPKELEHIDV